jgi:hypothetical protein
MHEKFTRRQISRDAIEDCPPSRGIEMGMETERGSRGSSAASDVARSNARDVASTARERVLGNDLEKN